MKTLAPAKGSFVRERLARATGFTLIEWLVAFVSAVMLIGTVFPKIALFKAVYWHVLKPLKIARPDMLQDNPEPHLFAQGVGQLGPGEGGPAQSEGAHDVLVEATAPQVLAGVLAFGEIP